MMMKSKETIVMRPISREVQRGFLADLGGFVSVILRSPSSAVGCINSPKESTTEVEVAEMMSQLTGNKSVTKEMVIIYWANNCWGQLLKYENVLLFSGLCHCKCIYINI